MRKRTSAQFLQCKQTFQAARLLLVCRFIDAVFDPRRPRVQSTSNKQPRGRNAPQANDGVLKRPARALKRMGEHFEGEKQMIYAQGLSKLTRKQVFLCSAAALFAACVAAQSVPAGWKVVQARYTRGIPDIWEKAAKAAGTPGSCQISVPPDWKPEQQADGGMTANAPGSTFMHPFSAEVQAYVPGPTFAQQVEIIKKNDKDFHGSGQTVVDDSAKRYWTSQKPAAGTTEWHVNVPGRPNCEVIVQFPESAANEALAKKIAATLTPAK